ncbi:MAG: hypothetical protein PHG06_18080 [Parabacteroides sp.]|nr:hypothetical protein [Parabacteroides sp.]
MIPNRFTLFFRDDICAIDKLLSIWLLNRIDDYYLFHNNLFQIPRMVARQSHGLLSNVPHSRHPTLNRTRRDRALLAVLKGVWLSKPNEKSDNPGTNFADRAVSVSALLGEVRTSMLINFGMLLKNSN